MSDVEIDQIRSVNPFRDDLPAPPIELVLRRLERETAPPSIKRRRGRAPSLGRIFVAASALVPVAVAILALSDLSAPRPPALRREAHSWPLCLCRAARRRRVRHLPPATDRRGPGHPES